MTASIDSVGEGLTAAAAGLQRFDLDDREDFESWTSSHNENTKRQIKYGLSVFNEFSHQVNTSYEDLDNEALDLLLSQFYKAARQKKGELYSTKSMHSIRYSLQRYFLESRGIDIIRGIDFHKSNFIFKAMLRKLRAHGKDEVRHHPPVTEDDMECMQASLDLSTPQGLQHKVFLDTLLHFPNTSTKNLRSMRHGDFVLHQEDSGSFYTFGKSQAGQVQALPGNPWCPVANMTKYIAKLNPSCEFMWQRPQRVGEDARPWYMNAPVGKCTLAIMIKTISESAGCTKGYTNKSLRLTSVTLRHHARYSGNRCKASIYNYAQNLEKKRREMLDTLQSTSNVIDVSGTCVGNPKDNLVKFVFTKAAPSSFVLQEIINSTIVPNAAIKACSTSRNIVPRVILKKVPRVIPFTCTSANKGIQQSTTRKQGNSSIADVKGVNKGTMTEQSLVETQRKLSQPKDACTQWEEQVYLKQLPTHSATHPCTSSIQELDTSSRGEDGGLERDGRLHQYLLNTPSVEVDESMQSIESSDVESPHESSVLYIDVESEGVLHEAHTDPSKKGVPSNAPILRKIKDEICDDPEPSDETGYQTFYIKEEYLEDDDIEDNNASSQNTPERASKQGGHSRLETTNHGIQSTQHTPGDQAPGQDEAHYIQSKKIYRLKFHLTQGKFKQILTINSLTATVSGVTIKDAVFSRLQCSEDGHSMQYFDDDWQEWIDVLPSMNLCGRTRLNVVRTSRELEVPNETQTIDGQKMHVLNFHVTLGDSKKVLAIYSPNNTATGATIKEVVCRMLQCLQDDHSMQYFDDVWQEWIDVAPSMKLKGGTRLHLVQAKVTQPSRIC